MPYKLNSLGNSHRMHAINPKNFQAKAMKETPIQIFNRRFVELDTSPTPPSYMDVIRTLPIHAFFELQNSSLEVQYEIIKGEHWNRRPTKFGIESTSLTIAPGLVSVITPVIPKKGGALTPISVSQLQASLLLLTNIRLK